MKRLLVALSLCALFAAPAFADTVNFTGTYPADACQFSGAQNGTFGLSLSSPLIWSTQAGGGTPASLTVNYIGQPTLSLAAVTNFSMIAGAVPNGTVFDTRGYLTNNGQMNNGSWWDTGSKTMQLSNSYTFDTLYVDLQVSFGAPPVAGSYAANTTVTCM